MRFVFASAILALSVAALAPQAAAAPITYEFTGKGTGQIGGSSFADALVEFTGTANTANVISKEISPGVSIYAVALDSLTVDIEGIGLATITDASQIIGIPLTVNDPQLPPFPVVLLMRAENPPDFNEGTAMAGNGSDGLAGYNLKTSISPIDGVGGVGFNVGCAPGSDPCIGTSMGLLSFTHNLESEGTFTAVREAPEPATLALMGAGLAAVVRRSRRPRR